MVIQPGLACRAPRSLSGGLLDVLCRCLLARRGLWAALLLRRSKLLLILWLLRSLILIGPIVRWSRLLKGRLVTRRQILLLLISWLRRHLLVHLLWHLFLHRRGGGLRPLLRSCCLRIQWLLRRLLKIDAG